MGGKTGLILLMAILCGVGAMYGAQKMLAKREAPPEMTQVVVASRDLKVEEVLKEDMLQVVSIPKSQAPAGAFGSPTEVVGRWIQIKMLAGEPIIAPKLAPKELPPGIIGRIPPNMRALAVEVNEQTGVSGFVLPDHRVDIVQGRNEGSGNGMGAVTILQNVQVLAVGQVTTRPEDKSLLVRTVTLAVTPEQAETLVEARSRGPLSLSLRGLNDTAIVEKKPEPKPEPEPEPEPEPLPTPAPAPAPVVVQAPAPPPQKITMIYRGFGPPERIIHRMSPPAERERGPRVAGFGADRPR